MAASHKKRIAAIAATVGFAALFVFQALLAGGAPLGRAAYWGVHETLPIELRISSAVSALLVLGAAWAVLARAGIVRAGARARTVARLSSWGFAVLFVLSALLNIASSSPWERFAMAPLAVLLAVCCAVVASGSESG